MGCDEQNETMNSLVFLTLLALAVCATALKASYPTPPPTFEAADYFKWTTKYGESRRGEIAINFDGDDSINMTRVDLVGDAHARGYAHGYLLSHGEFLSSLN